MQIQDNSGADMKHVLQRLGMSTTASDDFGGAFLFVMACLACGVIGGCTGRNDLRKEAVKAGVAEYRATPEGDVAFHWKEPAK